MKHPLITLITDFGVQDPYVACMKGVILSTFSKARIIDITHSIDSQNILQAAYVLGTAFHHYPKGSIHVAVVDPGVGSARAPILIETGNYFFIGPDNGIFTAALQKDPALNMYALDQGKFYRKPVSHTFHGRDIFAPCAAHLASGVVANHMGSTIHKIQTLNEFELVIDKNQITGHVVHIDKFGNAITNIPKKTILEIYPSNEFNAAVRDLRISEFHRTYSSVKIKEAIMLFDSHDFLEFAINQGSFAKSYQIQTGDIVTVQAPQL